MKMLINCFFLFSISLFSLPIYLSAQQEILLKLQMENEKNFPKKFRSIRDALNPEIASQINTQGLLDLNISGSGQFSLLSLEKVLEELNYPNNFYVIDLRLECHGFLNGHAVTWYTYRNWGNLGKSLSQVEQEEKDLTTELAKSTETIMHRFINKGEADGEVAETLEIPCLVYEVYTEEEALVKNFQVHYFRIPVPDHRKPTAENVDRFLDFIKTLPEDRWIHFHCAGGSGRTTSFMVMYDMIKNAKELSFEEIMERHKALGGKDLFSDLLPDTYWKTIHHHERHQFLKDFYVYCLLNQDNFEQSWSAYLLQNTINP